MMHQYLQIKYREFVQGSGNGDYEIKDRHWKLGPGPCGRVVTKLEAEISKRTGAYMVIRQHCKGQRKPDLFHIPLTSIVGGTQFLNCKE